MVCSHSTPRTCQYSLFKQDGNIWSKVLCTHPQQKSFCLTLLWVLASHLQVKGPSHTSAGSHCSIGQILKAMLGFM